MIDYSKEEIQDINDKLEFVIEKKDYIMDKLFDLEGKITLALQSANYNAVVELKEFYNDSCFLPTAESNRLYQIIRITEKELEYKSEPLFLKGVSDYKEALDKYIYSIMMMRRLILNVPENLYVEAVEVLQNSMISPVAYAILMSSELFEDYEFLSCQIRDAMKPVWRFQENFQFAMHMADNFPKEEIILEAASCCMDASDYQLAYDCLCKIAEPSQTTKELISMLKGALNG